jgi:biopolymer transport protein ExbD
MKLTAQTRRPAPLELNMASLVDVVFLLLIFFMCTANFNPPEERLPTPLPQAGVAGHAEDADFEPIRIGIVGSGDAVTVRVNDAFVADYAELEHRLRRLRALADVPTIIVPDDTVNFRHCVKVLDLCAKVGMDKVAFGG